MSPFFAGPNMHHNVILRLALVLMALFDLSPLAVVTSIDLDLIPKQLSESAFCMPSEGNQHFPQKVREFHLPWIWYGRIG